MLSTLANIRRLHTTSHTLSSLKTHTQSINQSKRKTSSRPSSTRPLMNWSHTTPCRPTIWPPLIQTHTGRPKGTFNSNVSLMPRQPPSVAIHKQLFRPANSIHSTLHICKGSSLSLLCNCEPVPPVTLCRKAFPHCPHHLRRLSGPPPTTEYFLTTSPGSLQWPTPQHPPPQAFKAGEQNTVPCAALACLNLSQLPSAPCTYIHRSWLGT